MSGFTRKKARQRAKNLQRQAEAVAKRFVQAQDALQRLNAGPVTGLSTVDLEGFHEDVLKALGQVVPKKAPPVPELPDVPPPYYVPALLADDQVVGAWDTHGSFQLLDPGLGNRGMQAADCFVDSQHRPWLLPPFCGRELHMTLLECPGGNISRLTNGAREALRQSLGRIRTAVTPEAERYHRDQFGIILSTVVHHEAGQAPYVPHVAVKRGDWPGTKPPYMPKGYPQQPTPGSKVRRGRFFYQESARAEDLQALEDALRGRGDLVDALALSLNERVKPILPPGQSGPVTARLPTPSEFQRLRRDKEVFFGSEPPKHWHLPCVDPRKV
jgi:hypothetical protein